jgi:hypothetical protein
MVMGSVGRLGETPRMTPEVTDGAMPAPEVTEGAMPAPVPASAASAAGFGVAGKAGPHANRQDCSETEHQQPSISIGKKHGSLLIVVKVF